VNEDGYVDVWAVATVEEDRMVLSGGLVLGVNSVYHESSACLLDGTKVLAFCEEERFSRVKRAKRLAIDNADVLPTRAIDHCLSSAGATWADVGYVAYSYDPDLRPLSRPDEDVRPGSWGSVEGEQIFQSTVRRVPMMLSELANRDLTTTFRWVPHHQAHAASAYFASPFDDSAILSIDALGEQVSTQLSWGRGARMTVLREITYPNSIGFLWETISEFVGLDRYTGPAKVMGLAAFGRSDTFANELSQLLRLTGAGFEVDNQWTRFRSYSGNRLEELFGAPNEPGAEISTRDADIACALQERTEQVMLALVGWLREQTGSEALCLAGGVALNCVANGRLTRESGFSRFFVQPAANDAGTSLGAALYVAHHELGHTDRYVMTNPYLGPSYDDSVLRCALDAAGLPYVHCQDVATETARVLADGHIVGWFQGGMEVGPRALGNRSILADPRRATVKDAINLHAKHREYWRPFSPSVLREHASDWLTVAGDSLSHGFMSFTYPVRPERRNEIPAIVHEDGCARAQLVTTELNPLYHRLISQFAGITGVPVVLNTSFNGPEEPIVCSPAEAVAMYQRSGLDALVLGEYLIGDRLKSRR
jgi:carbamoyltransferase